MNQFSHPRPSFQRTFIFFGIAFILVTISTINFVRSGPGIQNYFENNFRLIDGAKQQWAYEHHVTNSNTQLGEADLMPYLGRVSHSFSFYGEKYIPNALNKDPEALLLHRVQGLPKGTIIRPRTNFGVYTVLPSSGSTAKFWND